MSDLHRAFADTPGVTLSRLDELLALLQSRLAAPDFDHAKDLLRAVVSPGFSAHLHEAAVRKPS